MQTTLYVIYSKKLEKFYYADSDEYEWKELHQATFRNWEEIAQAHEELACRGFDKYWECEILPVTVNLEIPTKAQP